MKKNKLHGVFLDELKKVPIVQVACEKSSLSRNTVYRWRKEDKKFAEAMDKAMAEGVALINDLSEVQIINLIKEQNFNALSFWLRHHNATYRDKIEVTTTAKDAEALSPAQAKVVKNALKLATAIKSTSIKNINKLKNND